MRTRLRCAFDRWAWPFVSRWFHFEVDTEFLRGYAAGMKHGTQPDPLRQGNDAAGGARFVTVRGTTGITVSGLGVVDLATPDEGDT